MDYEPHILNLEDLKELQIMLASVDAMEKVSGKIRVLLLSIHYPFAIKHYFERALRRRDDVELISTGPYTGSFTPWMGGMNLPVKYATPPEIPLPLPPNVQEVNYELVSTQFPFEWKPDLVITIDAGIHWRYKPQDGYVVHVATDPHVLNYDYQRTISDKFFNMQLCYSQKGDIYLPYAYDVDCHRPEFLHNFDEQGKYTVTPEKDTDAVLIGMPYPNRVQWVNELRSRGVSVIFENGPIFDEAQQLYNRGRIGLNWSSMDDLNARAFEIPAMGLYPVMNYVPDLGRFKFQSYVDTFRTMEEAVEKVIWARDNPISATAVTSHAYQAVQGETYDARIQQILEESGFA